MATKGRPERRFEKKVWSALQTHLQGVDRATLAIMPEKCRHRAGLLSRLSVRSNYRGLRGRASQSRAIPGFAARNSRPCGFLRTQSIAIVRHPGIQFGSKQT